MIAARPTRRHSHANTPPLAAVRTGRPAGAPAGAARKAPADVRAPRFRYAASQMALPYEPERPAAAPRKTPVQPAVAQRVRAKRRHAVTRVHRDVVLTWTIITCFVAFCAVGIFYVSVFASVQALSFQLHSEQFKLAQVTARHHELIDQIGRLSSPDVISAEAPTLGMELPTQHAFIDVPAPAPAAPRPTYLASAPARPSLVP